MEWVVWRGWIQEKESTELFHVAGIEWYSADVCVQLPLLNYNPLSSEEKEDEEEEEEEDKKKAHEDEQPMQSINRWGWYRWYSVVGSHCIMLVEPFVFCSWN